MTRRSKTGTTFAALSKRGLTRKIMLDYSFLLSGQVGRVVFSVIYFITMARTLSLSDFGLFATASAIGVVLARVVGFGFISPLYRVATTKPQLIGVYTAGYITALLASLPLLLLLTFSIHAILYSSILALTTFTWIIAAEVLFWRSYEAVIIVLNGRHKFAQGSGLTIFGVATKAIAAVCFSVSGSTDLATWAMVYCLCNAALAVMGIVFFYPKQRLRWRPKVWVARLQDAVSVSVAEVLFYMQAELDKVLVLAVGGEATAGVYAIILRLVDLTAMPLRALNTMLVQWIMRTRQSGQSTQLGLLIDAGIGLVSAFGLLGIWVLLNFTGSIVGENVALGASFLLLVISVPALRNCIEYHTELLYAHERTTARVALLGLLTTAKVIMLYALLLQDYEFSLFALWLNVVFALLYLISALVTYRIILNPRSTAVELEGQSL